MIIMDNNSNLRDNVANVSSTFPCLSPWCFGFSQQMFHQIYLCLTVQAFAFFAQRRLRVCGGVCARTLACWFVCVQACVYVCAHRLCPLLILCICTFDQIISHVYIYIYICIYIYTYIYIYSQKTRGLSVNFSCLHINPPPIQLLRTEHKISNKRLKRLESHFTAELHHYIHGLSFNLLYVVWLNCC